MRVEAKIKFFLHWVDQPRNLIRTAGLVLLVGTGATYTGVTGIVDYEQQINRQVDQAKGPLSDEAVNAAVRRFNVGAQIKEVIGAEWNRDFNLVDVEDLKRRISALSQISAGLNSEEAAQDMAIMTLKSERNSYATKLKQQTPLILSRLGNIVSVAAGVPMIILGAIGVLGGVPAYIRGLRERREAGAGGPA